MSRTPTETVSSEEWQLKEIEAGLKELDNGDWVSHAKVLKWLHSWGSASEKKAPS